MSESNCDGNCHPTSRANPRRCCLHCFRQTERRDQVAPELQAKWNPDTGFWTPEGCVLTLAERPAECRDFICKDYVHLCLSFRMEDRWRSVVVGVRLTEVTPERLLRAAMEITALYLNQRKSNEVHDEQVVLDYR